ncbi:sialate O-acetylesterase [Zavarzinella formosa]|uniref:sialate O-acetylesterase n=1 Tax=Zavarzinella formosa TaxID=360055 RepID=UPI00031D3DDC|nr:sialate O-acetylesterase [Zavarzinella formosa]
MKRLSILPALSLLAVCSPSAFADVKLPAVLGSHMVVQRDQPLTVWGWADKDEEVTVKFGEQSKSAKADDKGDWKVVLPAPAVNAKPQTMTISGKNKVELTDILVGDVWVGSGQSNMEWPLSASTKGKDAVAAAKHPNIRLLQIPKVQAKEPAKDVKAAWQECSPATAGNFSAVLYFFGVRLQKDLDVPFGLINSSWGGSPIEPWTVTAKGSGGMHNGMIAPLQPFAIKGVIWYQGEANVGNGMGYHTKKAALIEGWRQTWGKDMPFYYVQIAPWSGYGPGSLPGLWEAQTASLGIPNTGMAVTTDLVDNIADIHPQNKLDVGNRLALWALAKTYGKKDIVYSGPLYKSMKIEGDKIRVSFAHTGGGLKSRNDKPLSEFQIAAEDGKFIAAEAVIDGNDVIVSSKEVTKPTQVRFGWSNIANPNLSNKEGLPASPFQTKDWKGVTGQ